LSEYVADNPLIVQSDRTILVEVASPRYGEARDAIARFAELEKSPEHIHTYRITPLSLWNAAASGMSGAGVVATLAEYGKYELPESIRRDILDLMSRYGRVRLRREDEGLVLVGEDDILIAEILHHKEIRPLIGRRLDRFRLEIAPGMRGAIKQTLVKLGYPPEDLAGYVEGEALAIALRDTSRATGVAFAPRDYQREAVDVFHAGGRASGGSGVIVLPCGAGKTIVGLAAMEAVGANTLILVPSTVAARQWMAEIRDKTEVPEGVVGEYSGQVKEIRPITVSTYQTLTYRQSKNGRMPHLRLFSERDWGLIIYDEVHLLPAPVFRATAELQARRRLGLTATLVREDGHAEDVFSLIGPKKFDVPWKDLEQRGWIATAECTEIRLPLPEAERMEYAVAEERSKYAIAAQNSDKITIVEALCRRHAGEQLLVIGQYIAQLEAVAKKLRAPLVTGKTSVRERERLFGALRTGEITRLVVSKVANFSIDLPDVNVAIQISGTYGSRQEEAQRLGRILRPKQDGSLAHFYTLVSRDTRDQEFASHRQLFLTEQGYRYHIVYGHELPELTEASGGAR